MSEQTPLPVETVPIKKDVSPLRSKTASPIPLSPQVEGVAAAEEAPIEDTDSTFGSEWGSDTTSIKDSIRNYRTLHGRTFHNYGETEYWGPNDKVANEQLDIGHQLYTLVLGSKLHLAPIGDSPQKVLDIGTGTGIWAIDFADAYPSAEVIGTDISPIQPSWVPPNLKFTIEDAQMEWTYASNTFDLIHLRTMVGCIDNWPLLYNRAFQAIEPGGWIEHMETDVRPLSDIGTILPGSAMHQWGEIFIEAGTKIGRSFLIAEKSEQLIKEAGFVDVVSVTTKAHLGPWSDDEKEREIGNWYMLFLSQGLENFGMYMMVNVLGWSIEEVQVYLARVRAQLKLKSVHGYIEVTTTYGRKPLERV